MKKMCTILMIINLLCVGILMYQQTTNKDKQTATETLQDIKNGSATDDVYIKNSDEKPKIAITFDDGPNEIWTPKLLDGLKKRGVKASFFVIGEKASKNQAIIKRMFEEGHIVGNHTFSHVQLTALSDEEACEEITQTSRILYEITGEYPQYIRPPFGSWNDSLECAVNLLPVMWNIDTLDWTTKNVEKIVQKALKDVKENSIILLHDNYESSVDAALRIVDELQRQGYEFVTVEELLLE